MAVETIFACWAEDERELRQAQLLAESLRTFGGAWGRSPVWVCASPETLAGQGALAESGLQPYALELDPAALAFPFAAKTLAAAHAERQAAGHCRQLVWMDPGVLFVQPPDALRLAADEQLACRPVDHRLIGSLFAEPPDPFWQRIYALCGVDPVKLQPMLTSLDPEPIRPYYNAGLLAVRPEAGLLRAWGDAFTQHVQSPELTPFYAQQRLYAIFVHQAILAGVLLSRLQPGGLRLLPAGVNYPLHLHHQLPADRQPAALNDVVCFRYEDFFETDGWRHRIAVRPPLAAWLEQRFAPN